MQQAEDAPGADERVPGNRNGQAIPADSMMQVGQEEQGTTGTAAGNESFQATVEDGPVEEEQGIGNEGGAALGTSVLQERSMAAESSATRDSRSRDIQEKTAIGNVDSEGQRLEDATKRPVCVADADITQPSSRSEHCPGEEIGANSATQATLQPPLSEQHEQRSQTSEQPLNELANLAPPLLSGATYVSPSAALADATSTAETVQADATPLASQAPAAVQATSTARNSHADSAAPSCTAQSEEGHNETDGPPVPIEHTRQPYSSQPGSTRYGPAASPDATSGQSSAGAAARGMPMRKLQVCETQGIKS